ncbi:hypothetical protein ACHAAC_04730 [Aeromicrobium sp. CF4.19]|uniref:hypothetical protein n=1 Tax=Aeromicrobium sp. CF4.19 TaxID=3373082 RepID=UPI003EE77F2D
MTATYASLLGGSTSCGVFVWRGAERDLVAETQAAGWTAWTMDTGVELTRSGVARAMRRVWGGAGDLQTDALLDLDGFFDEVGRRLQGSTVLIWHGSAELARALPELHAQLLGVLRDAVGVADDLAVVQVGSCSLSGSDGLL